MGRRNKGTVWKQDRSEEELAQRREPRTGKTDSDRPPITLAESMALRKACFVIEVETPKFYRVCDSTLPRLLVWMDSSSCRTTDRDCSDMALIYRLRQHGVRQGRPRSSTSPPSSSSSSKPPPSSPSYHHHHYHLIHTDARPRCVSHSLPASSRSPPWRL